MIDYPARQNGFRKALEANKVKRCAIVTGSFRAGTSFICNLLVQNGMPTIGKEKFNDFFFFRKLEKQDALQNRLESILASSQEGRFACKMMWPHRNDLAQALGLQREQSKDFAHLFPDAKWINIIRRDKIGQAISFHRAKQSNRWHVFQSSQEPEVNYDFSAIRKAMSELSIHDSLWNDFHTLAETNVINVCYEDFLLDVPAGLTQILGFLGPKHCPQPVLPLQTTSTLKKQRDELTAQMRHRLLEDSYRVGN